MNLFILDRQPDIAARYYFDCHVRKIILEAVEMMSYAYDEGDFEPIPKLHKWGRHLNHPMSCWVRRCRSNFDWTLQHSKALCQEFSYRHSLTKVHAYQKHVEWIAMNLPMDNLSNTTGQTDWPRCFGEWKELVGVTDDAVYDYRRYYRLAKADLESYTKRPRPDWL